MDNVKTIFFTTNDKRKNLLAAGTQKVRQIARNDLPANFIPHRNGETESVEHRTGSPSIPHSRIGNRRNAFRRRTAGVKVGSFSEPFLQGEGSEKQLDFFGRKTENQGVGVWQVPAKNSHGITVFSRQVKTCQSSEAETPTMRILPRKDRYFLIPE